MAKKTHPLISTGAWAALSVACAQVVLGVSRPWLVGDAPQSRAIPDFVFVALAVVFAGCAALLFFAGRRDQRASHLAAAYVCGAAAFAYPLLYDLTQVFPVARWLAVLAALRVEALLPFFSWRFAEEFPRSTLFGKSAKVARVGIYASLVIGVLLIAINASTSLELFGSPADSRSRLALRNGPLYWPPLLALLGASALFSAWRARRTRITERRRVAWLTLGLAVATAPVVVVNGLAYVVPAFGRFAAEPGGLRVIGALAYPLIVAGPIITVYAVLVHHALDVRLVIRMALRYALARYSLATLTAAPIMAAGTLLWINRTQSLDALFSGATGGLLLTSAAASFGALVLQGRLLPALDRLFFREQFNANRILTELSLQSRSAVDTHHLGQLLMGEIDNALHPHFTNVLIIDTHQELLLPVAHGPAVLRPLGVNSEIVRRLEHAAVPADIDWERPTGIIDSLGSAEAAWLSDGGWRLLVPLCSTHGRLLGVIGLGEKRSELPYSNEDKRLLTAISAASGLTIENRLLRSADHDAVATIVSDGSHHDDQPASECSDCGLLQAFGGGTCHVCQGELTAAAVPLTLGGKYRFSRRIGRGGMGVVYHAVDLSLGRDVAVKALPHMSPRHNQRLRREARAVAAVSHPNLAMIFATESLNGAPLLVFEYLPGGTLATRLERGPLSTTNAIAFGCSVADAVQSIHGAGILHRDIKPSNIGFSRDNVPKLLDFGLARMLQAAGVRDYEEVEKLSVDEWAIPRGDRDLPLSKETRTRGLAGTVLYMSPEAIARKEPDPSFDLWSICMVLYEAVAGCHPMVDRTYHMSLMKIARCEVPDIRDYLPEAEDDIVRFFREALSPDARKRPSTARELRRRLEELT